MPKTNKNKLGQTFHPLTEQAAREWYKLKFLNTPGYLLAIKSFFTKPDSDFVIPNVAKFCREWGISKSAFYRAINTLTSMGKLSWEATEGIVLKPHNKVTIFPRAEHCPTSGTVSHERDGDSHERDGDSHERDGDSHERDTPIYKDRARNRSNTDLNTDLIQISPLTPQGEQCEKTIEVEVEVLEEETDPEMPVTSLVASKNLNKDQSISKRSDVPGACDNKAKVDYELLVGIYNEYKPKLWRVSKLTSDRESGLKRLYKQFGEDTAQRIIDALTWAETDEFYSGRLNAKRRGSKFDMDTLLRKTKNYVEKWSENLSQDNSEQPQVDAERSTSNDFDEGFMELLMAAGKENY